MIVSNADGQQLELERCTSAYAAVLGDTNGSDATFRWFRAGWLQRAAQATGVAPIMPRFPLGARVYVTELEVWARVTAYFVDMGGLQYRCRYFYDGKAEEVYFLMNELREDKP